MIVRPPEEVSEEEVMRVAGAFRQSFPQGAV